MMKQRPATSIRQRSVVEKQRLKEILINLGLCKTGRYFTFSHRIYTVGNTIFALIKLRYTLHAGTSSVTYAANFFSNSGKRST